MCNNPEMIFQNEKQMMKYIQKSIKSLKMNKFYWQLESSSALLFFSKSYTQLSKQSKKISNIVVLFQVSVGYSSDRGYATFVKKI